MIQTQTFAFDSETRGQLRAISTAIERCKHDPAATARLIAQHDDIVKGAPVKLYDPREDA